MSRPATVEGKLLLAADELVDSAVSHAPDRATARLEVLEAVSCHKAGISINNYRSITGYPTTTSLPFSTVEAIYGSLDSCGIPFSLALSSLARMDMDKVQTKRNGAVYTDFRLSSYLASCVMKRYKHGTLIDPSCGTSIVLAACADEHAKKFGTAAAFVSESLYGVDLSEDAIRGSILALASYLQTSEQLRLLASHFLCADSLLLGRAIPSRFGLDSFTCIVGNPPWKRVRPSRNEYARGHGVRVDYGQSIEDMPDGYEAHRKQSQITSASLAATYGLKGGMDLYRAFLGLSIEICEPGGAVALYLPAGLIRSKSLAAVRGQLLDDFGAVGISVFMNRARFFSIDTRFKFVLALLADHGLSNTTYAEVRYCSGTEHGVQTDSAVELDRSLFCDESGALGAPEVKTNAEMRILRTVWDHGKRMSAHSLFSGIAPVREFDMTLDRHLFTSTGGEGMLPLIEGRMVSQFRCGCKAYVSGSGRSAKWEVVPPGSSRVESQYYIDASVLDEPMAARCNTSRVGFCDIAGQTNERAMQAALIPAGCACGNKVPTLMFDDDNLAMLWLGIANSFVFDWIVRRYITTTINFFILENLPFPAIGFEDDLAKQIIESSRTIHDLQDGDIGWDVDGIWACACERAKLDALVFKAYGLDEKDFEVLVSDFPLVDQINGRIAHSIRPTIELIRWCLGFDDTAYERARNACLNGALPYVPNEHARSLMR